MVRKTGRYQPTPHPRQSNRCGILGKVARRDAACLVRPRPSFGPKLVMLNHVAGSHSYRSFGRRVAGAKMCVCEVSDGVDLTVLWQQMPCSLDVSRFCDGPVDAL